MDEILSRLAAMAEDQHSVLSREQLLRAGADRYWIADQVQAGYLTRVAPATYRTWGVRGAFENRAMAAVLSATAPAVVSHKAAAFLHQLEGCKGIPGFIDVTVPRYRRPRKRPGVTFHESTDLSLLAPVIRNRVPVTGVARTILDCCRVVDDPVRLLDSAVYQRLLTYEEAWDCLLLHAVRGRHGVGRFRSILLERDSKSPPRGEFARRMGRLLVAAGVPEPVYEFEIRVFGRTYYLDLAWPDLRRSLECNDDASHLTPRNFRRDPTKRNHVELSGWRMLEYVWNDMVQRPAGVVAEVRQLLCS
ncbi:MAG: hypothetical protein ACRDZ3_20015 [Acidimicrobiia bacterium]